MSKPCQPTTLASHAREPHEPSVLSKHARQSYEHSHTGRFVSGVIAHWRPVPPQTHPLLLLILPFPFGSAPLTPVAASIAFVGSVLTLPRLWRACPLELRDLHVLVARRKARAHMDRAHDAVLENRLRRNSMDATSTSRKPDAFDLIVEKSLFTPMMARTLNI